jgi:DNA-binding PadR family transcriptional regulator
MTVNVGRATNHPPVANVLQSEMSSFSPKGLLAEREHLIMLAIERLRDDAYPVAIRRDIETRTGISLRRGGVYEALERLTRRGFLRAWEGRPTSDREGTVTRVFTVTRDGLAAMAETRRVLGAWHPAARRGR